MIGFGLLYFLGYFSNICLIIQYSFFLFRCTIRAMDNQGMEPLLDMEPLLGMEHLLVMEPPQGMESLLPLTDSNSHKAPR